MAAKRAAVNRGALIGGCLLALLVIVAALAPVLAPDDPRLSSGPPLQAPSRAHPFGTNDIGQDIFSEWLWGARASLVVGLLVTLLSTTLSWSVGIAAGLWRRAEGPLLAVTDLLLALPSLPLYLLVVVAAGPSQRNLVLALGLLSWPAFARVVRSQVITLRGESYIEAARALGAGPWRIARRHILPGTFGLLPAKIVLTLRFAIFTEATLAFLGLGDPALKSWGTMLSWAFAYPLLFLGDVWTWWVLPPALAIILVVLATTWLAIGLERGPDRRLAELIDTFVSLLVASTTRSPLRPGSSRPADATAVRRPGTVSSER
ncbi:MAG: ABC transporter permease [Chloroflexia bacterium]|nr:ABC transporter permease [Chloroflexia bacterium]MDQ3413352.1 ABC transporter permease [Chloroflexota bacterium]